MQARCTSTHSTNILNRVRFFFVSPIGSLFLIVLLKNWLSTKKMPTSYFVKVYRVKQETKHCLLVFNSRQKTSLVVSNSNEINQ